MPPNDKEEQSPLPKIEQRAGNRAIQIGQVRGGVIFQLLTPKTAIAIIAALAVIAAGLAYLYNAAQKPVRMTGDFNVAVAQFGEVTNQGIVSSARATQIGKLLFDFLDSEYKATDFGLKIQVAHDKIGILTEDHEAEQLASDINANVVIYGNIFTEGNKTTLSPRFYIADRPDTEGADRATQSRPAIGIRNLFPELSKQGKRRAPIACGDSCVLHRGIILYLCR